MLRLSRRRLFALAATAVATALLCRVLGVVEGLGVVFGLGAVASTAFLGRRTVRVTGAAFGGLIAFGLVRAAFGMAAGATAGAFVLVLAYRYAKPVLLRRMTFLLPSLVLLIFTTTLLMYKAPGNPFAQERVASPQVEAALRAQYGVPENALDFFAIYMRRLLVDGSLGPAIKVQGRTVEELLAPALPVSVSLGLFALVLASALGLFLGIRAGLRPGSVSDHGSMALAVVGISLPNFVIGACLMIVLSLRLGLFPVAGWGTYGHLAMPAMTLALPYAAYIARLARSGTIEVMQQDFIRTARAKGLPETAVVLRHALRGAVLPVVSFLGPAAAGILTGSFVVETLFNVPGVGQWFVKGAVNRDYSVVLGTAILYTGLVTSFNLLVDVAYSFLDPRVKDTA